MTWGTEVTGSAYVYQSVSGKVLSDLMPESRLAAVVVPVSSVGYVVGVASSGSREGPDAATPQVRRLHASYDHDRR